jgi:hypothetical protein
MEKHAAAERQNLLNKRAPHKWQELRDALLENCTTLNSKDGDGYFSSARRDASWLAVLPEETSTTAARSYEFRSMRTLIRELLSGKTACPPKTSATPI